jgi:transposase
MRSEQTDLWQEDQKEKRNAAKVSKRSVSKKGRTKRVFTALDFLTGKEKREYTKAGPITVTSLYDQILKRADFEQLEAEEQKKRLQHWRENNRSKDIQKEMGVSPNKFYEYIEQFGLPKAATTGKARKAKAKLVTPKETEEILKKIEQEKPAVLDLSGLNIAYNGSYKGDDIKKILNKLDIILDGEDGEFKIELKIMQRSGEE